MQDDKHRDKVHAPYQYGYYVACQSEIGPLARFCHKPAVIGIETADCIVDIPEYEPQGCHLTQFEQRHLNEVRLIDEIIEERLIAHTRHLKYLSCPIYAHEY